MKNIIWTLLVMIPIGITAQDRDKGSRKAMLVWQITEKLDLSEEQAENFFPKFRSHRNEMEQIEKEQKESLKFIFESLKDGKDVSNKDLDNAILNLESFETKKIKTRISFLNDLDGVLTTNQRAKLMMLPHGMRKEAKEKIKKHKKQKRRRYDRDRW